MNTLIQEIQTYYNSNRLVNIDQDFLAFEEDLTTQEDLELVLQCIQNNITFEGNPHNSIILYLTGLTSEFNFDKARADTKGGSPPDIDIDFEALGRDTAVDWVIEKWGRKHVANIMTTGTFGPKSLTRRYFKITDGDRETMSEILKAIPKPVFGKEADMDKICEAAPELLENPKYSDWHNFASKLEGMVANFGIHAAGIVISDFPIPDQIPCWKNKKSDFITQYDMNETEERGLIKFDFLVINNLDILKECVRLIEVRHNKKYNIYDIQDGDQNTYRLIASGLLAGLFQMETSGGMKDLAKRINPTSWGELSDILALYRPGPMSAGLLDEYIDNKNNGYPPDGIPPAVAKILEKTYWTLVYQEQVMELCQLAGFSMQEADSVRRAMGKKKRDVLAAYKIQFVDGLVAADIPKAYAENLWITLAGDPDDPDNNGFADYCFNASHSIAYAVVTYLCAYFKANYTAEFFTALMTVRSQVMQPAKWAEKAPQYVREAKVMNTQIQAPYIQTSGIGFTIQDNQIYFGLNGIKNVGITACKSIIAARKSGRFTDIWNFLNRVDRRKITTRTFQALIKSGAFDRMGYRRHDLLENCKAMYAYLNDEVEYNERIVASAQRAEENKRKDERKQEIETEKAEAKKLIKILKKARKPIPESIEAAANRDKVLREIRNTIKNCESEEQIRDLLSEDQIAMYEESIWLRKKPELKLKDKPVKPELERTKKLKVSVLELTQQAAHIGCYLHQHPAPLLYPDTTRICNVSESEYYKMAGQLVSIKKIKTRKGDDMAFAEIGDGTGIMELVIFPRQYNSLKNKFGEIPAVGNIVEFRCQVETVDEANTKALVNEFLNVYEIDKE